MQQSHTFAQPSFWAGRRVLLTGHSGFKGAWMALWLQQLGAEVTGVSLAPDSQPNLFDAAGVGQKIARSHIHDIRDAAGLAGIVRAARPEIVFHLAAQALVLDSYENPLDTFSSNVMGTANLLDALRGCDGVRTVVAITTDKVYRNDEEAYPFRENDPLGGKDPYSASKAACELVISSYRSSYLTQCGIGIAAARAGNVIGGGDWSANRLIPDAVKAWGAARALSVRNPASIRPWQHVLEPLSAYLRLAEQLHARPELGGSYNFGPEPHEAATVREVIGLARSVFGRGEIDWNSPPPSAHEAKWLALETAKARQVLGIAPRWSLHEGVARTMQWYRDHLAGADAATLCQADLAAFTDAPGAPAS